MRFLSTSLIMRSNVADTCASSSTKEFNNITHFPWSFQLPECSGCACRCYQFPLRSQQPPREMSQYHAKRLLVQACPLYSRWQRQHPPLFQMEFRPSPHHPLRVLRTTFWRKSKTAPTFEVSPINARFPIVKIVLNEPLINFMGPRMSSMSFSIEKRGSAVVWRA